MDNLFLYSERIKKRLTIRQAAKAVGVSSGYYCQLESGIRTPSVSVAKKIAGYFGFDWTEFFR